MIKNEEGFTWASCDNCTFTMGVGFAADRAECMSAFRQWGWTFDGKQILCDSCAKDKDWFKKIRKGA